MSAREASEGPGDGAVRTVRRPSLEPAPDRGLFLLGIAIAVAVAVGAAVPLGAASAASPTSETGPELGSALEPACEDLILAGICSLVAVNATGNASAGLVAVSGTGNADGPLAVSGTGEAAGGLAAVSGAGNATADTVATSGAGEAAAATAASALGDARANQAVSGTGDAEGGDCRAAACAAVSGTGNATGPVPVSVAGECREKASDEFDPCFGVSSRKDTRGFHVAVSGTGNASSNLVAASGTRSATAGSTAVSGTGNASGCGPFASEPVISVRLPPCLAVSGTGESQADDLAASAMGDATGDLTASGTGDADGCGPFPSEVTLFVRVPPCLAVSGTGDAQADDAAASGTGNATGRIAAVSGGGDTASETLAVSGTGDAAAQAAAASGTGNATSTTPVSVTGGCRQEPSDRSRACFDVSTMGNASGHHAAVSTSGDATGHSTAISGTGDANANVTAISVTGNATGPQAVDTRTPGNAVGSSTRDRDHSDGPTSTGWPDEDQAVIRPGASVLSGTCTGNFIFSDPSNSTLYIGTAAHCLSDHEIGDRVEIAEGRAWGHVAFNARETPADDGRARCEGRDFGLIKISDRFRDEVHPAVKAWGGPTDLRERARSGEQVFMYGNSSFRAGSADALQGWAVGNDRCRTEAVVPGILDGDSGSPLLASDGEAMGVVVRRPGTLATVNLAQLMEFTEEAGGLSLELKTWPSFREGLVQNPEEGPNPPPTRVEGTLDGG